LNADQVRQTLRRDSEEVRDGATAARVIRRFSEEGRYVVNEIELRAENRSFQERVRLFTAQELAGLLEDAGLRVTAGFGDYDGRPVSADTPRVILVGERA
jgi:uncharacterized membrane protein